MANIRDYLAQILSARYGKDVRNAIHDSIEEINNVNEANISIVQGLTEQAENAKDTAVASATTATTKATEASTSASTASTKASEASQSASSASTSAQTATTKASEASASASSASNSATTATTKATEASTSASTATTKASEASASAQTATTKASEASASAQTATTKASEASTSASNALESEDNAEYWYNQAKAIAEGFAGTLIPMGTVAFTDLPSIASVTDGWMYNISDEFTTTSDFAEGAGIVVPMGSNIYKTAQGKWDVLAGSPVTGVKGDSENTYKRGNVNITKADIGLGNVDNTSDADKPISTAQQTALDAKLATTGDSKDNTTTYTSNDNVSIFNSGNLGGQSTYAWTAVSKIATDEKHSSLFNKVSTMFKNIRTIAKLIGTTDISAIGNGTISGGLSALNSDLISSITRSGTTFTAKNEDGTALFTFTQQDSNTTTGTNYAAGSIPNNTTFCTNRTVKNVYDNFNARTTLLAANIQGGTNGNKTLSQSMANFRNLSISIYNGSEQLSEGFADLALFKSGGLSIRINYYDGSTVYNIVVSYVSDTVVKIQALYPSAATLGCRIVGYN